MRRVQGDKELGRVINILVIPQQQTPGPFELKRGKAQPLKKFFPSSRLLKFHSNYSNYMAAIQYSWGQREH